MFSSQNYITCAMGSFCSCIDCERRGTRFPQSSNMYNMKTLIIIELIMCHVSDMAFTVSGSGLRNFDHTLRNSEFYLKKTY